MLSCGFRDEALGSRLRMVYSHDDLASIGGSKLLRSPDFLEILPKAVLECVFDNVKFPW